MSDRRTILLVVLSGLLVAAEGIRVAWYHRGEPEWIDDPVLTLRLPREGTPGLELLALEETRGGQALAFDHGVLARLFDPEREAWSMDVYYLEYEPGNSRQLKDMFDHSPEVCLRASGSRLVRTLPHLEVEVDGRPLLARHLVFVHPVDQREFHVFKLVWLARMQELGLGGEETDFRKVRLQAAWGRHSRPPARMILASLSGARGDDAARARFKEEIVARCFFREAAAR